MSGRRPLDLGAELVERFDHALRVTEYVVGEIPRSAWRVPPAREKARTIAAIVAHIQSVRRTFGKMGGGREIAPRMDPARATPRQAAAALRTSRVALVKLFGRAIDRGDGRLPGLPRRVVDMILYLTQHDAHHRGQIAQRAKDLGVTLNDEVTTRAWGWKKLP